MQPGPLLALIRLITRAPRISRDIKEDIDKNGKPTAGKVVGTMFLALFICLLGFIGGAGLLVYICVQLSRSGVLAM
jgi:hypothetical protein